MEVNCIAVGVVKVNNLYEISIKSQIELLNNFFVPKVVKSTVAPIAHMYFAKSAFYGI